MVAEGPEEGRPAQVNELTPLTGHPESGNAPCACAGAFAFPKAFRRREMYRM